MNAWLGQAALCLALLSAVGAICAPMQRQKALVLLQLLMTLCAFFTLMSARITSDFSLVNVADHSNLALPLLYKVTGTWGNHEGSMLLWVLVLAAYSMVLSLQLPRLPDMLRPMASRTLRIQSLLAVGFLVFILLTSNPFITALPAPPDGKALNPLLQDIGLALHPPMLYLGYVGFSLVFSLACAALWRGGATQAWAEVARPYITIAWSFLTLGIGLGSWWAYRELGWGGWWFWDPVENASLLPWLTGTALMHSTIALQKRNVFSRWVALLSILTFAMSLIGTFLVRSGVLTSVHSFASDPERGFFMLAYMAFSIGGALLLFAWRSTSSGNARPTISIISREGGIAINNIFLVATGFTVLLGTIYPLILEWLDGSRITVGAPYFNLTVVPMMIAPIMLAGIAPLAYWGGGNIASIKKQLWPSLMASLAAAVIILALIQQEAVTAAVGFSLATWLIVATVTLARNMLRSKVQFRHFAVCIAHLGVAVLVLAITATSLWSVEAEQHLQVGEHLELGGYSLVLEKENFIGTPNYLSKTMTFSLRGEDGNHIVWLTPEFRFYALTGTSTSEAAVYSTVWKDIYVVVGEAAKSGGSATRVYIKPMMGWLWSGFILMALGGFVSVCRRRNR